MKLPPPEEQSVSSKSLGLEEEPATAVKVKRGRKPLVLALAGLLIVGGGTGGYLWYSDYQHGQAWGEYHEAQVAQTRAVTDLASANKIATRLLEGCEGEVADVATCETLKNAVADASAVNGVRLLSESADTGALREGVGVLTRNASLASDRAGALADAKSAVDASMLVKVNTDYGSALEQAKTAISDLTQLVADTEGAVSDDTTRTDAQAAIAAAQALVDATVDDSDLRSMRTALESVNDTVVSLSDKSSALSASNASYVAAQQAAAAARRNSYSYSSGGSSSGYSGASSGGGSQEWCEWDCIWEKIKDKYDSGWNLDEYAKSQGFEDGDAWVAAGGSFWL